MNNMQGGIVRVAFVGTSSSPALIRAATQKPPKQFAQTVRDDVAVWGAVIHTDRITVD